MSSQDLRDYHKQLLNCHQNAMAYIYIYIYIYFKRSKQSLVWLIYFRILIRIQYVMLIKYC
jgi:hypothetical protein